MNQFFGLIVILGIIAIYMVATHLISKTLAKRLNVSPKTVGYVIAIIVFILCSYLVIYTDVYQKLSDLTGIPLKKK
jgi:hypothetical protein